MKRCTVYIPVQFGLILGFLSCGVGGCTTSGGGSSGTNSAPSHGGASASGGSANAGSANGGEASSEDAGTPCVEPTPAPTPTGEFELPRLVASIMEGTADNAESDLPSDLVKVENIEFHGVPGWTGRGGARPLSDGARLGLEVVLEAGDGAADTSQLAVSFDGFRERCGPREHFRVPITATVVKSRAAAEATSFVRPLESRVKRQPNGSGVVEREVSLVLRSAQDAASADAIVANAKGVIVGGSAFLRHYQVRFATDEGATQGQAVLAKDSRVYSVRPFTIDEERLTAEPSEWRGVPLSTFDDGRSVQILDPTAVEEFAQSSRLTRLPEAWERVTGANSDVDVMILDGFIYPYHDQLRSTGGFFAPHRHNPGIPSEEIWRRQSTAHNFLFHGTHAAGVACAVGNDGKGTHGTSWGCRLHVFDAATGISENGEGILSQNMALWASEFQKFAGGGPKVVNISFETRFGDCEQAKLGMGPSDPRLLEWLNFFATFPNTVFVVAAGNCGIPIINSKLAYSALPAALTDALPNVIAVGAIDHVIGEFVAPFSNFGKQLTIAAPAAGVWSTAHSCDVFNGDCKTGFAREGGTSVAAPHVTGVVALMREIAPDASPESIKVCLIKSGEGREIGLLVPKEGVTVNILDAARAIECITEEDEEPPLDCDPPPGKKCPHTFQDPSPGMIGSPAETRAFGCKCRRDGCRSSGGFVLEHYPGTQIAKSISIWCEGQ